MNQPCNSDTLFKLIKRLDDLGLTLVRNKDVPIEVLVELSNVASEIEDVAVGLVYIEAANRNRE